MTEFKQFHILTVHGPSNLNRDDTGRPKECEFGGAHRLRISSQAQKRAWRTSVAFQERLQGHLSLRTKFVGDEIEDHLQSQGVDRDTAVAIATQIAGVFGAQAEKNKAGEAISATKQLVFVAAEELAAAKSIADRIVNGEQPNEQEMRAILGHASTSVDIAMFGRMLADKPDSNVEAAIQVSHAITTHKALTEVDFYTAVDDLKDEDDDRGAGHVGQAYFGSGVYYSYICIDVAQLEKNLAGDTELAALAIESLVRSVLETSPSGKRASFGSSVRPIYVLAEKGSQQPRNLMAAFLQPVSGSDRATASIEALEGTRSRMDAVYGKCADDHVILNAITGEGSIDDFIAFVKS